MHFFVCMPNIELPHTTGFEGRHVKALPTTENPSTTTAQWSLLHVLFGHVLRELIETSKMGFGVPIDSRLHGPLRPWAEDFLGESRLKREGYFNPAPIRQKRAEYLSGQRNWQHHLWGVLMFQAWLAEQGPTQTSAR